MCCAVEELLSDLDLKNGRTILVHNLFLRIKEKTILKQSHVSTREIWKPGSYGCMTCAAFGKLFSTNGE